SEAEVHVANRVHQGGLQRGLATQFVADTARAGIENFFCRNAVASGSRWVREHERIDEELGYCFGVGAFALRDRALSLGYVALDLNAFGLNQGGDREADQHHEERGRDSERRAMPPYEFAAAI